MRVLTNNWGQSLVIAIHQTPGGLNKAVDTIRSQYGSTVGVTNSFRKLYNCADPSELNSTDQWRAWLLLTAIGEDPAEWGIYNDVVPGGVNAEDFGGRLAEAHRRRVHTLTKD